MEKSKTFHHTYFPLEIIKRALDENLKPELTKSSFRLRRENVTWEFDDEREFFSEYRKPHDSSTIRISNLTISITLNYSKNVDTTLTVGAQTRGEIENVFEIFEDNCETSIVKYETEIRSPIIFIGHGQSPLWRDLKDHLSDKHGYKIEAYETGARAGHAIRDILDEMVTKSSFAILVLTGEDEDKEGNLNARPNVVHELGLFQGKLGFSRAIVLLEDQTKEFSNLSGIQQLRFSKGNIKETFGDILATLKREFENK